MSYEDVERKARFSRGTSMGPWFLERAAGKQTLHDSKHLMPYTSGV